MSPVVGLVVRAQPEAQTITLELVLAQEHSLIEALCITLQLMVATAMEAVAPRRQVRAALVFKELSGLLRGKHDQIRQTFPGPLWI